jgi:pentatricopeptide repeat protein
MLQNAIEPNNVACVSLLKACCNVAALDQGRLIHSLVIESSFESHAHIRTTIIDMYAKCGSLDEATTMFQDVLEHNNVTWNALITGYGQWGDYASAVDHFRCMQKQGLKPDDVTFVCLLSSCSQRGLLGEACQAFQCLGEELGEDLLLDHYNCMIDVLGRLGRTTDAEDMLSMSPFHANSVGWSSLLGHCKRHGDVRKARNCFDHLVEMDEQYSSGYATMSDAYMDAGMWSDAKRVLGLKDGAHAWKKPGKAFIEVQNRVHDFTVGDQSHPESDEIFVKLRRLDVRLKQVGYTPQIFAQY